MNPAIVSESIIYDEQPTNLCPSVKAISLPQSWQAKLPFEIRQAAYTIKTADSIDEFMQVLELRREVFLSEFSKSDLSHQQDFEELDLFADFLIIKEHDQVVASYRLIFSEYSHHFYSNSEFDIQDFLNQKGHKLELSRACVKKQKRAGIVLHLLWRGLAEYMMRTDAKYLFGCSSVQSLDLASIVEVYRFLFQEDALCQQFSVNPLHTFHIINLNGVIDQQRFSKDKVDMRLIPPLLLGYIKAGAKVYGSPALDLKFSCLDFFTVLNYERLSSSHLRKYIKGQVQ
ncbi:MAG: GNAT family N-acetyltransferase [Oligoflexus sp.]